MLLKFRKVKQGKVKDPQRDGETNDCYYILVGNKRILLNLFDWDSGVPIKESEYGDFILINGMRFFLDYSNIEGE